MSGPALVDVDLFAGPGGLDEGRRIAGHDTVPLLGLEWEQWACWTARAAGHTRVRADVAAFPTAHLQGLVRMLMGAPPCPTFSAAGKGAGRLALDLFVWAIGEALAGRDVRAQVRARHAGLIVRDDPAVSAGDAERQARDAALVLEPARWIHDTHPEAVLLEQVPAVLPIWQAMARALRVRGWSAWAGVLNAANYGVPQTRQRAIFIASRVRKVSAPDATHAEHPADDLFGARLLPWVSMGAALGWDGMVGFPRLADTTSNRTSEVVTLDGVDYRARDFRTTDEPAQAVTEKARSWQLRVGRTGTRPPAPGTGRPRRCSSLTSPARSKGTKAARPARSPRLRRPSCSRSGLTTRGGVAGPACSNRSGTQCPRCSPRTAAPPRWVKHWRPLG